MCIYIYAQICFVNGILLLSLQHGSTYGGNPLASRVAMASLQVCNMKILPINSIAISSISNDVTNSSCNV